LPGLWQEAKAKAQALKIDRGVSPLDWVKANATIVHPQAGRIAFTPYPYQVDFFNSWKEQRRIVLKARQVGYSQSFALEALYVALHTPDSTILLVSRSQDIATNLLRYCYQAHNGLKQAPDLDKANESEIGFPNGSRIKSIPANRSTGRGFAATRVYLDEFAYAEYADDIYQSILPTIAQGGSLTIASTPNGVGNLFYRLWIGSEWWKQEIHWRDCPRYWTPEERESGIAPEAGEWYTTNRPNYTTTAWAEEFDCDFAGSGGGVFPGVEKCLRVAAPDAPLTHNGHRVVIGVDWAKRSDYTVLTALCVECGTVVDWERFNQIDYTYQRERLKAMCQRWHVHTVLPERNSIGDPNIEMLLKEKIPIMSGPDDKPGFETTATSKPDLIELLRLRIERGEIAIPKDYAGEMQSYEMTRNKVTGRPSYSAPDGLHDDRVISLALAAWAGRINSRLPDNQPQQPSRWQQESLGVERRSEKSKWKV
jgi:hypothetical protein